MNTVYNTDCLTGMKTMPAECVDLVFTDPPYYQHRANDLLVHKNNGKPRNIVVNEFEFDDFESEEAYLNFMNEVIQELYRICKQGASGYMWCCDDYVSYLTRMIEGAGFKFRKVIHWHKTNPFPAISTRRMFANSMEICIHFSKGVPSTWNFKSVNEMHNFIETPSCKGKERTKHRTQKPLKVCIPYIEISSNEGDLVFDPFMGSGTTAIAAMQLNRNFLGYEVNKEYCEMIQTRFDEFLEQNKDYIGEKPQIQTT